MTSSVSELRAALERRAAGAVEPAPIEELVRRGNQHRRRLHGSVVALSAVLTALVVILTVAIVGRGTAPAQKPSGQLDKPTGLSAQQIADGHWSTIPKAPHSRCDVTLLSTGSKAIILSSDGGMGCPNSASLYDPQTNKWSALASPPPRLRSGYWQTAWTGSSAVVVANDGSVAELTPSTDRWTLLPRPPSLIPGATVVADSQRIVVMGSSANGTHAASFDGSKWSPLPDLAVPFGATPYLDGDTLWAFATEGSGEHEVVHVFRLDGTTWRAQPRVGGLPLSVSDVQRFGGRQLVTGQDCPRGYSCAVSADEAHPALIQLGTTFGHALPPSPFDIGMNRAIVVGQAIVGIDSSASDRNPSSPLKIGAVAAYDPSTGKWHSATRPPRIRRIYGLAWTRAGLIEIGPFHKSCNCDAGGAILHPSR